MSGVGLGAVAGIGFGLFQVVNRRINAVVDVYLATFALMAVSTALLAAISVLTEDPGRLGDAPPVALAAFASAGFVHFFLGWTFLGLSQQRLGAARTGALQGSVPLVGALLAVVVLGEALTVRTLLALLIVVAGVVAISLRPRGAPGGATAISMSGLGFALATALCWSISPLLIRLGLDRFASPILGVTVGLVTTTLAYGVAVAVVRRQTRGPQERPPLGLVTLAGTLVALSIWWQWAAFRLAPVGVVLAMLQLSVPVVAIVSPLVFRDPLERGGVLLWVGMACVLSGALIFLLGADERVDLTRYRRAVPAETHWTRALTPTEWCGTVETRQDACCGPVTTLVDAQDADRMATRDRLTHDRCTMESGDGPDDVEPSLRGPVDR